ncbi:hypothetical protein QFC22_005462 [Naganishia vaughanmartiniae]|uniref:Uncharacterized protein n=1 Tax=Naganishia vaughanmartiniae TaxID=1424756 RepID=A0ACC2WU18_9TREE|nr:hypothetical protein QFC22_005462 [Naganishia vaughanmartiniae]
MPVGKIFSYPNNWRVKRVQAVAACAGEKLDEVVVDMQDTKKPAFLAKWPMGCVPTFEGEDGTLISESAAIAEHVARITGGKLIPTDSKQAAEVSQWISIADQELAAPHACVTGMIHGYVAYAKPVQVSLLNKLAARLATLDRVLLTRTFIVGERLTLADIALASVLFWMTSTGGQIDAPARAKIPNVVRYLETIVKSPKLASVFGELNYVETAPQFQAPKKEGKADKPKADKPAAAVAAPVAKKEKAKKPADDDDDDEPLVPAEPKAKNPLDDLPKSSFVMDEWKRKYSNEDTLTGALPWFYENFDPEGYSCWRIDYKYNDELTQVFMSANLIGGFFARLEASRKYAMGSMGVFGKSNDSIISGAFVVRGKDAIPVLSVAPDWESYKITPLDITTEEGKKFFNGAMSWELEIDGKPWADGKIFK